MNVLIACEESQTVCKAFRARGHNAFSCDIKPCSGGHPEWHIQCDVLHILNPASDGWVSFHTMEGRQYGIRDGWDLIIAHPPCTYLSNAGARFLYPKGVLNVSRFRKGMNGREFFMKIWNCSCPRIAIENPTPSKIYELPKNSQVIHPYEFGHPFKKRTLLWLKGLPTLSPTDIIPKEMCESTKIAGNWFNKGGKDRAANRAKTFPGIAEAMAEQWGR